MENQLGRILTAEEVVHHIDGNPLNNDAYWKCRCDVCKEEHRKRLSEYRQRQAGVVQKEEHPFRKRVVGGSSPLTSSN